MKKYIFIAVVLFACINLNAQEKGKLRVGGNIGATFPSGGAGLSIDLLDIRYNILDNLNAGIKFGGAYMMRDLYQYSETSIEATMHLSSNFMLVSDYYFNKGNSIFAPFVGAGVGMFSVYDLYFDVDSDTGVDYTEVTDFPDPQSVFGGSLRAGFELGKFRMALEYYMIPQTTKFDVINLSNAGTASNSYLCLNLGFYFGGGSWKK